VPLDQAQTATAFGEDLFEPFSGVNSNIDFN